MEGVCLGTISYCAAVSSKLEWCFTWGVRCIVSETSATEQPSVVDTSLFSSHSLRKDHDGATKEEDSIRSQHSPCWLLKISSTDLALCGETAHRERPTRIAWLLIGKKGTVARSRVVGSVQGVGRR